ncbi:Zinc metalloproteinase nas-4 [Halotydeus destructor]|nr:Zinc metalloproteinase nas-4 [Halotydeus destructor]
MKLTIAIVGVTLIVGALGQTSPEPVEYEDADMSLYDIREGDLLVPKGSGSPYKVAYKHSHRLWPNGIVPYTISNGMSDYQKKYVLLGQQLIEKHTCVRFQKRTNEYNHVEYINGNGCYSYVGRAGGKQPISLGHGCQDVSVSAHETMHALGIFHEQSRPDRDNFITINWNNVAGDAGINFDKANAHEVTLPRTFDFKSIMLYDPYIFSSNGRATMVSKVNGQRMLRPHEKPAISQGDILLINHLYNCPATGSKATSAPAQPTKAPTAPSKSRRYPEFDSECPAGRWAMRDDTHWWCEPKVSATVAPPRQTTPSPVTTRRYPQTDAQCPAGQWAVTDGNFWWCETKKTAPVAPTTPSPVSGVNRRHPALDSRCPTGYWAMTNGQYSWCERRNSASAFIDYLKSFFSKTN